MVAARTHKLLGVRRLDQCGYISEQPMKIGGDAHLWKERHHGSLRPRTGSDHLPSLRIPHPLHNLLAREVDAGDR